MCASVPGVTSGPGRDRDRDGPFGPPGVAGIVSSPGRTRGAARDGCRSQATLRERATLRPVHGTRSSPSTRPELRPDVPQPHHRHRRRRRLVGVVGLYVAYDQVLRGDDARPSRCRPAPSRLATRAPPRPPIRRPATSVAAERRRGRCAGTVTAASVAGTWNVVDAAARPATGSASSSPTSRPSRRGRPDERRHRRRSRSPRRATGAQVTDADDHGRHHHDRLATRAAATTGCEPRGSQTDQFPTATFTITRTGRHPRGGAGGDVDRRDAARRPDAPRRDEVRGDPGAGAAPGRPDPGRGRDTFPLSRLRHRPRRTSAGSSSRSPTRGARVPRWSLDQG